MALYRGYSGFEYEKNKTFAINDIELVKLDLLNHIFTRRGERVMMPNFGTIIPDLTFEPLDDITVEQVREELLTVFDFDPRVDLISLNLIPNFDDSSILAQADLFYIELNIEQLMELRIEFESFTP